MEFKDKFIERYSRLTDIETFKSFSLRPLIKSIRVNTLKTSIGEMKDRLKRWNLKPVPWCKEGFFIDTREVIGNTIEHSLGYFYVQGAISMIPPLILDLKEDFVLDMCAAPGSKTTQMAALMKNKGMIIANDHDYQRLKSLRINLERCGVCNTVITYMSGRWFENFKFDRILLDAPCSGTGTIRKSYKTIKLWNPNFLKKMSGVQRQLIKTAFTSLKEGGIMTYSTCSLEPEENEKVVDFLIKTFDNVKILPIKITGLKYKNGVTEFEGEGYNKDIKKTIRIWPQDNDTEGFYIAKIKKV